MDVVTGVVGTNVIAEHPDRCNKCNSLNINIKGKYEQGRHREINHDRKVRSK